VTVWEAVILGFVQGVTEFLPVSSSGHLVIAQSLMGTVAQGVLFEVCVHVATLLSILIVYRARIGKLVTGVVERDRQALAYVGVLVAATVPIVAVGGLATEQIESLFEAPMVSGVALLVTGVALWSSRRAITRGAIERPALTAAVLIGVAQVSALVPGMSRSGVTVVAALWLGVCTEEAAVFSFLMAVPVIAGAGVLQIPNLGSVTTVGVVPLLAGCVVAATTGVFAIRAFVGMLNKRAFHLFAPYCWVVGAAFLSYLWLQ